MNLTAYMGAFTEFMGTSRRSEDFDLVVEVSDGELEVYDTPEDDESQLLSRCNSIEGKAKQQPRTQNP